MGKNQKKHTSNEAGNSSSNCSEDLKVKRSRRSVQRDSPSQRSSVFRGVTRHRWTGRYEAHLWDKNCWNESQNKKGKQVYLGAYDDEEAAAHTYDLAALKYWGHDTVLNFPLSMYQEELKTMEGQSREEYIRSLRRKSSGFSRGVSKYRGVARHHQNGRWEARIGRVFGNKYLYLGTYATQEEAAAAYDLAAIEYRGLNAVTNFDLSWYMNRLRPAAGEGQNTNELVEGLQQQQQQSEGGVVSQVPVAPRPEGGAPPSSALGILLQSSKFKEMLEMTSAQRSSSPHPLGGGGGSSSGGSRSSQCSFPEDIQIYFECHDGEGYAEGEDSIFGDLSTFMSPTFECELDV